MVLSCVTRKQGIAAIVALARTPAQSIVHTDHLYTALASSQADYRSPDLLLSIGPHPGMPLGGIPPLLLCNAEVMYAGEDMGVLDFVDLLEEYSSVEQRFGK